MNFFKTLFIIGVITLAIIAVIIVATACVIAGRESKKEQREELERSGLIYPKEKLIYTKEEGKDKDDGTDAG